MNVALVLRPAVPQSDMGVDDEVADVVLAVHFRTLPSCDGCHTVWEKLMAVLPDPVPADGRISGVIADVPGADEPVVRRHLDAVVRLLDRAGPGRSQDTDVLTTSRSSSAACSRTRCA